MKSNSPTTTTKFETGSIIPDHPTLNPIDAKPTPQTQVPVPSISNCEDLDAMIKPEEPSSNENSVVLTIQVDAVESLLEWSARMKRYQQEEVQYLGLNFVKPNFLSPPMSETHPRRSSPPIAQSQPLSSAIVRPPLHLLPIAQSQTQSSPVVKRRPSQKLTPQKDTNLSKQLFEEWLDTLHLARAGPAIPASQPSTFADSDKNSDTLTMSGNVSEGPSSREDILKPKPKGDSPHVVQDSNICNSCGKSIWNQIKYRDWGVQTDVSGCLIIF